MNHPQKLVRTLLHALSTGTIQVTPDLAVMRHKNGSFSVKVKSRLHRNLLSADTAVLLIEHYQSETENGTYQQV